MSSSFEVDLRDLHTADEPGALEALIAAAQRRISIQEEGEGEGDAEERYVPPELPVSRRRQDDDGRLEAQSSGSPASNRVETRMEIWWRRRNEKIEALRRQIDEQQRAQEVLAATPAGVSVEARRSRVGADTNTFRRAGASHPFAPNPPPAPRRSG